MKIISLLEQALSDSCSLWHGYAINAAAPNPVLTRNAFLTVRLAISPASLIPENFHRPAEIHLPSGKSIGQIFFRHHRHQKTRSMFHKRQFRVQHAIGSFYPIPFRKMSLLNGAHQHQIIMQSCRGIINPIPEIFICLMKAKRQIANKISGALPLSKQEQNQTKPARPAPGFFMAAQTAAFHLLHETF